MTVVEGAGGGSQIGALKIKLKNKQALIDAAKGIIINITSATGKLSSINSTLTNITNYMKKIIINKKPFDGGSFSTKKTDDEKLKSNLNTLKSDIEEKIKNLEEEVKDLEIKIARLEVAAAAAKSALASAKTAVRSTNRKPSTHVSGKSPSIHASTPQTKTTTTSSKPRLNNRQVIA